MDEMDRKIARKVAKVLKKFPYKIEFEVKDRIVFLKGKVETYEDRLEIGFAIGKIKGVDGVVNDIEWKGMDKEKIGKEWERRRKIFEEMKEKIIGEYDVVIIGAGVIGAMIARELSRYELKIALIEKNYDASLGASKANNGMIHPGVAPESGTLKAKLNPKGNAMYDKIIKELNVRFKRVGSLWVITPKTLAKYKKYLLIFYPLVTYYILPWLIVRRAKKRGIPAKIIRGKKIFELEPNLRKDAKVAVYIPTTGILDPYELTYALVENAVQNGVELHLKTEAVGFIKEGNKIIGVVTNKGVFKTKFVINAAGVYADEVAEMAGAREYTIHPRKGAIIIFDKTLKDYVRHCVAHLVFPRPKRTKGGGVNPTVHGNIMWGPTAVEVPDKEDISVDPEDIEEMIKRYGDIFPDMPRKIIRYFAGVRAATFTEDFIIRPAKWVKGFIHVAGIQSPGLASAPAITEMVIEILRKEGLKLEEKEDFNPYRQPIKTLDEMSLEEIDELIKKDPRWGRVVCTCEGVTEAQVVEAIRRGARSIDAIKRWTRAGMGTCQGQKCILKIAEILARELGIPLEEVTKEGPGSELFAGKVKEISP